VSCALDIRDLSFTYPDGTEALHDLDLNVHRGECVGVVGRNGAGKTTLVMLLSGMLTKTAGRIRMNDIEMNRHSLANIRACTGYIFHSPDDQLFMPTVLEDVCFGPLAAGSTPDEVERTARAIMANLGIEHLAAKFPGHLSAGQKRLATLAGVLIMDPDLLVLDEPTGTLDPQARRHLLEILSGLSHTRLIVTHDLELVVELCSRVIVLDDGCKIADGSPADILGDETLMKKHGLEKPHILRHRHPH